MLRRDSSHRSVIQYDTYSILYIICCDLCILSNILFIQNKINQALVINFRYICERFKIKSFVLQHEERKIEYKRNRHAIASRWNYSITVVRTE